MENLVESLKDKKFILSILFLVLIVVLSAISLTACQKELDVAIYVVDGLEIEPEKYPGLIKDKEPILSGKDILSYNPETGMIYLSENILEEYRKEAYKYEDVSEAEGCSLLLGEYGIRSSFIMTVDGEPVLGGALESSVFLSCIPNMLHISDSYEGVRIYEYFPEYEDEEYAEYIEKGKKTLEQAFRDSGKITDKVFNMRLDTSGRFYNTKKLWENRTDSVGDNSKVGGIISEFVFPDGIEYKGFRIESEEEPYGVVLEFDIPINDPISFMESYTELYKRNAEILLSLVGNLNRVEIVVKEGEDDSVRYIFLPQKEYDKELWKEHEAGTFYFKAEKFYDQAETILEFYEWFDYPIVYGDSEDLEEPKDGDDIGSGRDFDDEGTAKLIEKIMSSPSLSSNPSDYIEEHPDEYETILKRGDKALSYILNEFKEGSGKGLRGHIMANLAKDIIGITADFEFKDGEDWYNKFINRKVVNLPSFEYKGKNIYLKSIYNLYGYEDDDETFHIMTMRLYDISREDDLLKIIALTREQKFKLYQNNSGEYFLYDLGSYLELQAPTYREVSRDNLELVENGFLPEPVKNDSEYIERVRDICKTPSSGKEIEGLADSILEDSGEGYAGAIRHLLVRHLLDNGIEKVKVVSFSEDMDFEFDERRENKFAYFDDGIFVNAKEDEDRELSEKDIEDVNRLFDVFIDADAPAAVMNPIYGGKDVLNPICHVLSSYYEKPEDINIARMVYYMDREFDIDEEEFKALKELDTFPYPNVEKIEDTITPVGRIPDSEVSALLETYLNTSLDSLSGEGMEDSVHLGEPYNAFYSYASDFGPGMFIAVSGKLKGDTLTLYGEKASLILERSGDRFYIVSHLGN